MSEIRGTPRRGPKIEEVYIIFDYLRDLAPPRVMFDVGAHAGSSARLFLEAGWSVFAFEPDPVNRRRLLRLAEQFSSLSVDARAVADVEKEGVSFYSSGVSSGISSLTPFHPSHAQTGTVDVTTISAFCKERAIDHVDFLKIDTEGHDFFVLKGFPWEDCLPAVVVCEFEDLKTRPLGYGFSDMADFLRDRGYEILISEWYPIEKYGARHSWRRFVTYPCGLEDQKSWGNVIGFHGGIDWERLQSSTAAGIGRQVEELYLKQGSTCKAAGVQSNNDLRFGSLGMKLAKSLHMPIEFLKKLIRASDVY